jgi:hypothetical protein
VTITLNMILNKTTQPVITKTNIRGERWQSPLKSK